MSIALWVVQGVLGAAFLMAGFGKITRSREQLTEQMAWVEDVGDGTLRLTGVSEILGAAGLILPGITGIAVALTPLAALGLGVVQIGAFFIHRRRGEGRMLVVNMVLLVLLLLVAWGRLGPYPLA